jgi:C4-dicarboxylate-specific signal transduction histidine kinase
VAHPHPVLPFPSATSAIDSDLDEIYTRLVATLRDLLNCTSGAILFATGSAVDVRAQFGPQPLPNHVDLEPTAMHTIARMAQERKPLIERRTDLFQPLLPTSAADLAWIGIPMFLDDQLHACISLTGRFLPGDEQVAFALAGQAAATLHWARRYTVSERQARQAQQLMDIEQQIRHMRDQVAALDYILDMAMAFTGATHSYVVVSQQGRAVVLARCGYSQAEATLLQQIPPSLDRGLTGRAYQTRAIARSDDIQVDPAALPALAETHSQLIIPICTGEQVRGLIDLQSPQPATFQAADEEWLLSLGKLTAGVIERQSPQQSSQDLENADIIPQHELLLSSRLTIVTDLAAGVAHEINNPLTSILGYAHLLLRDQSLPQEKRDDIGQIMIEGQRIAALVERFLRFAQPASSGKRPLAINEPLLEALGLLKGRLQESGIHVVLDLPSEPLMVLGQAGQLEQAFLDLLHNAIEALSATDNRRIAIHASQQGGIVRVAISDSGRGIMPDLLTRVFEPGFTTKVDKGISRGLGLGLYAAHTIIQDHWGRIEVQSQIWQGSIFTVCLPAI